MYLDMSLGIQCRMGHSRTITASDLGTFYSAVLNRLQMQDRKSCGKDNMLETCEDTYLDSKIPIG